VTVKREDVFDISKDKFVYEPIIVDVELTIEQKKLYDKLVKDGFSDDFYLGKAQAAELNIRLQDICIGYEPMKDEDGNVSYRAFKENPKLEALIELLEEIDEDEQVVIMCSRTKAIESIASRLTKENISFVTYSGAQDGPEKKRAEEMVATKQVRVFLANITAAGFGLNALKDFNYIVWYCVNDSPEQIHQAQHRILRGESKTPKFAYSLFCNKTVELKQFQSNKNGEEFIKFRNTKEDFLYG
jgi:SNF2 family DNA or RNA helicase